MILRDIAAVPSPRLRLPSGAAPLTASSFLGQDEAKEARWVLYEAQSALEKRSQKSVTRTTPVPRPRRKTVVRLRLIMLSAALTIVAGEASAETVSSGTAFAVA